MIFLKIYCGLVLFLQSKRRLNAAGDFLPSADLQLSPLGLCTELNRSAHSPLLTPFATWVNSVLCVWPCCASTDNSLFNVAWKTLRWGELRLFGHLVKRNIELDYESGCDEHIFCIWWFHLPCLSYMMLGFLIAGLSVFHLKGWISYVKAWWARVF